ncbi:uncharacterized protein LOC135937978 [Cloeon dipterum]|uniref:uncharacterized protein LOC135937978 n=1 Tax=Cloeon dipterum TaxID=197152 RepID=UPI00321FDFF8
MEIILFTISREMEDTDAAEECALEKPTEAKQQSSDVDSKLRDDLSSEDSDSDQDIFLEFDSPKEQTMPVGSSETEDHLPGSVPELSYVAVRQSLQILVEDWQLELAKLAACARGPVPKRRRPIFN